MAVLAVAGPAAGSAPRLGRPPLLPDLCPARTLRPTYTFVFGSNATGHVEYTLTVTNHGRSSCTVVARLKVALLGRAGQALPTRAQWPAGAPSRIVLVAGQSAQAISEFSPDFAGPGEPATGDCEPVAHALRVTVGAASVRAPMDPTPVCGQGTISFQRLRAIPVAPVCPASPLRAGAKRDAPPFDGFAEYSLTLHNRQATACHVNGILGLRLGS